MSYEFYKVLHVFMVVLMVAAFAPQFVSTEAQNRKLFKITSGIASFLLFVGGMGLLARIGVSHGAGWPVWVKVKVGLWVAVSALGPILAKRMKSNRLAGLGLILALIFIAIFSAVTKY
ncbi:SirB2 family protein [Halobacteriovorax sp. XZX-3]|uniref:SirB2 family protein n=1 Tax=unclassified Halobacteriovorax TaxID=2639665 RepID=UPI000CD085E3|nr:SirB2 family protein [Halobacteriovorax sp. DA5]POB15303.1 hypothetical protein C0Z22_02640 [Halobacteriovorax sp. DA5]